MAAFQKGDVVAGDMITLECLASPFGPFLRNHVLMPFIGTDSSMRLGPIIVHNQHPHPIFGLMENMANHWMPVGLLPPVCRGVHHVYLYPADAMASGVVGLMPNAEQFVVRLPAFFRDDQVPLLGNTVRAFGRVGVVGAEAAYEGGLSPELFESVRQIGRIMYIDFTDEYAEVKVISNAHREFWGGLYACGHVEFDGELSLKSWLEAFADAATVAGFSPQIMQNLGTWNGYFLFARGFRAMIFSDAPVYSLHMDAELSLDFGTYKRKFDTILDKLLQNINEACTQESAVIINPLDVDFSYVDSTRAYSVLKSKSADELQDPLLMVVRDWHRSRGK